MKNVFKLRVLAAVAIVSFAMTAKTYGQALPTDNENVYVSLELQGVLELTMVTDPNVDFVFNTIPQYVDGIIKTNVTELKVESTVPWDLHVNAETAAWEQFSQYSTSGSDIVPSSIIGIRAIDAAGNSLIGSGFTALNSTDNLPIIGDGGLSDPNDTPGAAGSYLTSPNTHQFRVDYQLQPGLDTYQAGYYGINLIYTLAEDL